MFSIAPATSTTRAASAPEYAEASKADAKRRSAPATSDGLSPHHTSIYELVFAFLSSRATSTSS